MNLYDLHSDPESLDHFEKISDNNPDFFWEKYKNKPEELKKREKHIAKSPIHTYQYARDVLKGPFPLGEEAISKGTQFAYSYARDILQGPFPAGEEAIAKNSNFAFQYAGAVLKKDFYLNGKLICKA